MSHLRTLLIAALPVLVLSSKLEYCSSQTSTHHNSVMLASLQCYNDFTAQIHCTWEEEPYTNIYLPISYEKPCVPDSPGQLQPSGKLSRSCIYKTAVFSMDSHVFFFNISCPSKVTTFNIAAHGKVLPPTKFSEKNVNGGDRLLSWSSPYPPSSPLTLNLTYQVKYRRHEDEWTVVGDINVTTFVIACQALVPGYSYEARVRARGPVGLWSDWSPKVVWMIEEEGVMNLQCVIKETGVACSWQVTKSQAELLSYHLCGHTSGTNMKCVQCDSHSDNHHFGTFRGFTCSLDSSEPELLSVEIRSLRKAKEFSDSDNIQPPRPKGFQAHKKDGFWELNWSQPDVNEKLRVFYQVYLERIDTKDETEFNVSGADLSVNVPSNLLPSTGYMAKMRAFPGMGYAGRPSDWSDPVYFSTDPASWTSTVIYVLIAVLVSVLFIILYNALPACHRRLVLWDISIPSPINSKVLGDMSTKKCIAGEGNPYIEKEKTSVFIIQASDNPIICKGSISECPLLTCSDDSDMSLGMSESEWPKGSSKSSLFVAGNRLTDKSGVSFIGPYILCCEDFSVPSEPSDTFFSSFLNFNNDGRYISETPKDSLLIKGGYVLTVPTNPTSECSPSVDCQANENREPRKSELPDDDPPAYTPSPAAVSSAIFSHPSGYCLMPNMETWVSSSVQPPEGNTDRRLHEIEGESPEKRSYVTLAQRGL